MSVATELAPEVFIPPQARPGGRRAGRTARCGDGGAVVPLRPADLAFTRPVANVASTDFHAATLYGAAAPEALVRPRPLAEPARLRLTRRGIAALALATVVLGAALLLLAWRSAPQQRSAAVSAPAVVSVQAGDTLWSIAQRIAPDRDPRDEVAELQSLNRIADGDVRPGQLLRTR